MASSEFDGALWRHVAERYDTFAMAWCVYAALGQADDWGGSQSRRAVWAWRDAGFPPLVAWLAAWLAADDRLGLTAGGEVSDA